MENMQRKAKIKAFLEEECGLTGFRLENMVADASVRKYFRVIKNDGTTAVLMDDESPNTRIREFVKIDELLRSVGVLAPKIYAQKVDEGQPFTAVGGGDAAGTGGEAASHLVSKPEGVFFIRAM